MSNNCVLDSSSYVPVLGDLLSEDRIMPLDAGTPDQARLTQLRALDMTQALAPHPVQDRDMAEACKSAIWLYHDFLEESHTISQSIETSTGSYWHGIMHRRELDFSNAKYWFRRVGEHPIFDKLREEFADDGLWDPLVFVDQCQQSFYDAEELAQRCLSIQQREWQLLFDFCYHQAIGT